MHDIHMKIHEMEIRLNATDPSVKNALKIQEELSGLYNQYKRSGQVCKLENVVQTNFLNFSVSFEK